MGQKEVTPCDRILWATRATPEPTSSVACEKSTPNPPVVAEERRSHGAPSSAPGSPPPGPDRTVDLHVNEAGRQDAAPAVPLLVGYEPLLKEELLWVQNAAVAHPQILPAERGGARVADPAPCTQPVSTMARPCARRLRSRSARRRTRRPHAPPEQPSAPQDAAVGEPEHRGPRSALSVAHLEPNEPSSAGGAGAGPHPHDPQLTTARAT